MPDIRNLDQIGLDTSIEREPTDGSYNRLFDAVHLAILMQDRGIDDWQVRPVMVVIGEAEPKHTDLWLVSLSGADTLPEDMRENVKSWGYSVVEDDPDNSRWGLAPKNND